MNAEFAGTLREQIVIEAPSEVRNAMGLLEAGWTAFGSCRAAIALEGAGSESEGMALSAMPRFKVTIRAREDVSIDQRVRWGDRLLMVRQVNDDPRTKQRITLRCEEVRK